MDDETIDSEAAVPDRTRLVGEILDDLGTVLHVDLQDVSGELTGHITVAESEVEAISGSLQVDERYQVQGMIARGGMGAVLATRDVNCRRSVAMKVMLDRQNLTPQQVVRFIEEAQVTAQLEHPSIVPVHELGVDGSGNVFYTMKYVRGMSLRAVITKIREGDEAMIRDYPLVRLLAIYLKACDALAFAHSRHVVHRDLKPENIMLGDFGEVLVVDWGLAKILGRPVHEAATDAPTPVESIRVSDGDGGYRTMDGVTMGTPRYMAPEQALGRISAIDGRTDIYALGGILYAILTLRPPVSGENVHAIMANVMRGEIQHPSVFSSPTGATVRPRKAKAEPAADSPESQPVILAHIPGGVVPSSLAAVAMKALALEQADRYADVGELQREIEAYLGGFATHAEEASLVRQVGLLVRRHRAPVAVAAVACLVLIISVAAFVHHVSEARDLAVHHAGVATHALENLAVVTGEAAPVFVERAEREFAAGQIGVAAETARIAVGLDPENAAAWCIRGRATLAGLDLATAEEAFANYLALIPDGDVRLPMARCYLQASGDLLAAPRDPATDQPIQTSVMAVATDLQTAGDSALAIELQRRAGSAEGDVLDRANAALDRLVIANPGSTRGRTSLRDGRLVVELSAGARVVDLAPLRHLPIAEFSCTDAPVVDLSPLAGMPLQSFSLRGCPAVESIAVLRGMPLSRISVVGSPIRDLTPLADARLTSVVLNGTRVADLSPLRGQPITSLGIGDCPVTDLSPLSGMPLDFLFMGGCAATDISALQGLPLTRLLAGGCRIPDLSSLANLPLTGLDIRTAGPMPGRDYTSLRGLPLTELMSNNPIPTEILEALPLTDLIAHVDDCADIPRLAALPLKTLRLTIAPIDCDLAPLRDQRALTTINGKPAATVWAALDAQRAP